MKLTREQALRLHRQMWRDMQTALGDNPSYTQRVLFKDEWCEKHFPDDAIFNNCFLCEYLINVFGSHNCMKCLIKWPGTGCVSSNMYNKAPISEILALPERRN